MQRSVVLVVLEKKKKREKKRRWKNDKVVVWGWYKETWSVLIWSRQACANIRGVLYMAMDITMTFWSMHFGLMLVRLNMNTEKAASRLISKKTWWSLHQRPTLLAFWFSPIMSCAVLAMSSKASYSSLKDSEWSLTTLGKGAENGQSTERPTKEIFPHLLCKYEIMAMQNIGVICFATNLFFFFTSHSRPLSKDSACHMLWEVYPPILQLRKVAVGNDRSGGDVHDLCCLPKMLSAGQLEVQPLFNNEQHKLLRKTKCFVPSIPLLPVSRLLRCPATLLYGREPP